VTNATVHSIDAYHCIATWDHTLIQIWRGETAPEAVAKMGRIAIKLISGTTPAVSLSIIEESSGPPGEKARAELAKFSKEIVSKMAAAVIVAEGSGFRTALVRGVGVTLTTLAPHRVPYKFFATSAEGITHLAPHIPAASGGPAELRRVLEHLRKVQFPVPTVALSER
jgi:hypothetical protein